MVTTETENVEETTSCLDGVLVVVSRETEEVTCKAGFEEKTCTGEDEARTVVFGPQPDSLEGTFVYALDRRRFDFGVVLVLVFRLIVRWRKRACVAGDDDVPSIFPEKKIESFVWRLLEQRG
jgi:hypothetical protein